MFVYVYAHRNIPHIMWAKWWFWNTEPMLCMIVVLYFYTCMNVWRGWRGLRYAFYNGAQILQLGLADAESGIPAWCLIALGVLVRE